MKVSFLDKEVRPTRRQWFMARKGYWGMGLMKNTYSSEEKILNKLWILLLGWTPQSIVFYGPYLYLLGRWRLKDFCSQEFLRPSLPYSFCFVFSNVFPPKGLPLWLSWWKIRLQYGRPGFDPWIGKIPWRREWLPTPVFWPGEFQELYSLWVAKSRSQLSNFHIYFLQKR